MDFWAHARRLGHNVTIIPPICGKFAMLPSPVGLALIVNRILCHGISQ